MVILPGILFREFTIVGRRFCAIATSRLRLGDENAIPSDASASHESLYELSPASWAGGTSLESGSGKGTFMICTCPRRFPTVLFFIHGILSLSVY